MALALNKDCGAGIVGWSRKPQREVKAQRFSDPSFGDDPERKQQCEKRFAAAFQTSTTPNDTNRIKFNHVANDRTVKSHRTDLKGKSFPIMVLDSNLAFGRFESPKRIVIFVLLCVGLLGPITIGHADYKADFAARYPELEQAEHLAKNGNPDAAIEVLTTFLDERHKLTPEERINVIHRRAKFYGAAGRYAEAQKEFDALLRQAPAMEERIAIRYEAAKYTQLQGDVSRARERYSDIVQKYGREQPLAWGVYWSQLRLAAINWRRGFSRQAITEYERICRDPTFGNALKEMPYELGAVFLFVASDFQVMNRHDKAVTTLQLFLTREPNWPDQEMDLILIAKVELARSLLKIGRGEEAKTAFNEVLNRQTYAKCGRYADYPAIVARIPSDELQILGATETVAEFLKQIKDQELMLDKSLRRNILTLFPDPRQGLEQLRNF